MSLHQQYSLKLSWPQRRGVLRTGLILAGLLCLCSVSYAHSGDPFFLELQVGQSGQWTVSPDDEEEREFNTDYSPPEFFPVFDPFSNVSITPNTSVSTNQDVVYTITGLTPGTTFVQVPWFYPGFGGVSSAVSISVTVIEAQPDPFDFLGILHRVIQADFVLGDVLKIINQDINSDYGVDLLLGDVSGKWFYSDFRIDPAQVPGDAMGRATSIGSLNGVPNQILAQLNVQMNGTKATVSPDFIPLGTTSVAAKWYNGKNLVYEKSGIGFSDYPILSVQAFMRAFCGPDPKTGNLKTGFEFPDGPTQVENLFGESQLVNRIVFQAEDQPNTIDYLSEIRLRAYYAPFFELGNQRLICRKRHFGYRHETIGFSHLDTNLNNELVISDLIDSGNNGLSVNVGKFTGVYRSDLRIDPLALSVGDRAEAKTYGSLNGVRDQLLGTVDVEVVKKGSDNVFTFLPDFLPIGSPEHKVRVYDFDDLVFSADNATLPCIWFSPPEYACYFCGGPPEMDPPMVVGVDFFERTPITVSNNQVVDATRIVWCPQTITETVDYTRRIDLKFDSQTFDQFTAVREQVSRFTSDLFTGAIGDARIRNLPDKTRISGFDDGYNVGVNWSISEKVTLDFEVKYEFSGIDLNKINAGYRASYFGDTDAQDDTFIGQVQLEWLNTNKVGLTADFLYDTIGGQDREVKVDVVQNGQVIGEITVAGDIAGEIILGDIGPTASAPEPNIPLIQAGIRPMGNTWCYFLRFDSDFVYTSPDNNDVLEGDELRVLPVAGTVTPNKFTSIDLTGKNIEDIVITNESTKLIPKPILIASVQPSEGGQGTVIKIVGENFGNDPDALCVIIKDGNRSIPIHVTEVNDSLLCGTLGAVPPDSSPTGQVMVEQGQGHRGTVDVGPGLHSGDVWTWNTIEDTVPALGPGFGLFPNIILPPPDPNDPNDPPDPNTPPPDPNGCKLFDSGVADGKLCITVDCEWPEDAKVSISGRIRDTTRHKGLDLFAACAIFEGGPYSAFDCAQRICDLLKTAWLAQAGFHINCTVTDNGDGTAKITITFPPPCHIDWGNLTICVLRSGVDPAPTEEVDEIGEDKFSVKAGKDRQNPSDQIGFSGTFNGDINDLLDANDITIAIGTGDDIVLVKTIPVDPAEIKKGKFKYKEGSDSLQLDFNKGTFKLGCKGVDLTGLGNPVTIEIGFGDYVGSVTITNPIPLCMLTGVADALQIDKVKLKNGADLAAQGGIAREDLNLDLTGEDVTIEWANGTTFSETIAAGGFERKKPGANVFVYKKPKEGPGAISSATLDFDKCSFKVQIKDSPTQLASTGDVTLSITSANFEADDTITLP